MAAGGGVGWRGGYRMSRILSGWGQPGTGARYLLSLHLHPPYTPSPVPSSGKPLLWVLGPHYQSLVMYFKGSRGITLRFQGSSGPGETLLPANPSCHLPH